MEITPEQLRQTRKRLGLTTKLAAMSVHVAHSTWQGYESPARTRSFRPIPMGLLELFCIKHGLPFPPLRQDGTLVIGSAQVLSFVSATGGCGKTLITLELARLLALNGQRVAVVTDSVSPHQSHSTTDNPIVLSEAKVVLTGHEIRDMQMKLRASGVVNDHNQVQVEGTDYFLQIDEIRRLADKSSTSITLRQLTAEHDFVLLDISTKTDAAVLVSDAIIYILDVSRAFATIAASKIHGEILRKLDVSTYPRLFCLLTNNDRPPHSAELGGKTIQQLQMSFFETTLSKAHVSDREALSRKAKSSLRNKEVELLVDEAPASRTAGEYRSLANELLARIGSQVRVSSEASGHKQSI